MTDEELLFLARLVHAMSTGPWKVNTDKAKIGENWGLAWALGYGQTRGDDNGRDYYIEITTDGVHCSELGGGASEDAAGIVALRNSAPYLIGEIRRLRERVGPLDGRRPLEIVREATGINQPLATTAEIVRMLKERLDRANARVDTLTTENSQLIGQVAVLETELENA